MKKKPDTHLFICVFLTVLAFFACAHGFGVTNLIFSGNSLNIAVSENAASEIASGSWLQPFYFRLRGGISAPMMVGLMSLVCITVVCFCVCSLLDLKRPLQIIGVCGAFVLSPGVLACFCGSMNTADASFLAMAFGAAGVLCFDAHPLGWMLTGVLFAVSASLSFEACSFGAMLLVLLLVLQKASLLSWLKSLASCLMEAILYVAGLVLFLRRFGADCSFLPLRNFSAMALLQPCLSFFEPFNAYPLIAPLCVILLIALFIFIVLRISGLSGLIRPTMALLLLLPISAIPCIISGNNPQVRLTDWLFALVILQPLLQADFTIRRISAKRVIAGLCGIVFLGQIVFANQIYLKKNLEYQSTLSVMTRVLTRLEETEGFIPGKTQVAFYGSIDDGSLSVSHQGFESLDSFEAAKDHFGVTDEELNTTYFWQILGYPVNALSDYERDQLRDTADLSSLKAFPEKDCIRWCGSVLVMKLSD